jgi:hypothetical protein
LPAIFLVSTVRQLISLFFFSKAISSNNRYLKYFYFIICFVSHFTGVINVLILFLLNSKKYFLCFMFIFLFFIFYSNFELLLPLVNKIEHYSDESEAFLSFYKILICTLICIISLFRIKYKNQIVDKFILFYIFLILLLSYFLPSVSLRLFNSIYFLFIIYTLNSILELFLKNKTKLLDYEF